MVSNVLLLVCVLFSILAILKLNLNFDSKYTVAEFHNQESNMLFNIGLGDSHDIQRALFVACFTLFAIFLVKLFNARMHFVKLKRQGLVRSCPIALAYG